MDGTSNSATAKESFLKNLIRAFGVFLVGFVATAALQAAAIWLGYQKGMAKGWPAEAMGNPLAVFLLTVNFILLLKLSYDIGRRSHFGLSIALVAACSILLLPVSYLDGVNGAGGKIAQRIGMDRASLRAISRALEDYRADLGSYPASLDTLFASYSYARESYSPFFSSANTPHSFFGSNKAFRYALNETRSTTSSQPWLLWSPGPDNKYDLKNGPEIGAALAKMDKVEAALFFRGKTYDATNGTLDGDLIYLKPD